MNKMQRLLWYKLSGNWKLSEKITIKMEVQHNYLFLATTVKASKACNDWNSKQKFFVTTLGKERKTVF